MGVFSVLGKIFSFILYVYKEIASKLSISTKGNSVTPLEKERLDQRCQEIFTNELILLEIFNNLPMPYLYNSRLVNSQWYTVANSMIVTKNLRSIGKGYVKIDPTFKEIKRHDEAVEEFVKCIKSSKRLLFTTITLNLPLLDFNVLPLYMFLLQENVVGTEESSVTTKASPLNSNALYFVQFLKLFGKEIKVESLQIIYDQWRR